MSYLVANLEDRFSHEEADIMFFSLIYEPLRDKTNILTCAPSED